MDTIKFVITKHETIRRTEKVEYEVIVPENIQNKADYALCKLARGDYDTLKVVDIVDSELLDEEVINLKQVN